ncbi:cytoplasmic protein [Shewanella intestini]|uniref:Cytoplasmic protein n=1 Tax=Shewanella intestini TaxID=2017544 RepID=A0ABS5HZX4_9GAMM|nr:MULTISPECIES: cytoplasmic protein [Shewanella]MBR9727302.1 cytoplasmic protein [Shewanella intestini]MRG35648.1 cytoplasmic protein [Shewanella sp. XMDDZSB0408]
MTAITHVYNYTVRCPHYKDNDQPASWLNHIEINQSCEIALNRITKWHTDSGTKLAEVGNFIIRKADGEKAYFVVQSDRLPRDGHALVTFKILLNDCCQDADPIEITKHLVEDYQQRLAKVD